MSRSLLDTTSRVAVLKAMLKQAGLTAPHTEFRFDSVRRWKFDYAIPAHRVAIEQEGGAWTGGRHVRGTGFLLDCKKYSEAAAQGWLIIRVPPKDLCTENTIDWVRRAILSREP